MKRVIILTQPLRNNYGGLLQAYALQKVVKDLGYDVTTDSAKKWDRKDSFRFRKRLFIAQCIYPWVKGIKPVKYKEYKLIAQHTSKFVEDNLITVDFFKGKKHPKKKDVSKYDIFLVGSDQVWRKRYSTLSKYYLAFLNKENKTRIAYAASFGLDNIDEYTNDEKHIYKQLAKKFNAISVREKSGLEILKNEFGIEAEWVLDPTLLLAQEDYLKLCFKKLKARNNLSKARKIFYYVLDKSEEKRKIIDFIQNNQQAEVFTVMPEEKFALHTTDITKCVYPAVEEWVLAFNDCDFVITDSFHGTVFSIIFNKPFCVVANKTRGIERLSSLLEMFGLQDRLISSENDLTEDFIANLCNIDFETINNKKELLKTKSLEFLKHALSK
ncbi:MAG: polysaccharide pyruvyl transferase family protein [Bacteroidales bacterium]|nr:polysaccharide pyruvyl transferase family protein [Bacteroidales bacterium]